MLMVKPGSMLLPESSDILQPMMQGYQLGKDMQSRSVMEEAGQFAARGDMQGAERAAYAGGNFDIAQKLQTMSFDKQAMFHDTVAKYSRMADTPEKWAALTSTMAKRFGPESVKGFEDFSSRGQALQISISAADMARNKLLEAQMAQTDRLERARIALQARSVGLAEENAPLERQMIQAQINKLKPGALLEERKAAIIGANVPIDSPEAKRYLLEGTLGKPEKGKDLSVGDVTKLSETGAKFTNSSSFVDTFKDVFAGYGSGTAGDIAMWAGRNMPLAGKNTVEAANWWQQYDRYKNTVRHELFGSALTATERSAFEKADITPGMKPEVIKRNLESQRKAMMEAVKKQAAALIRSGYDPDSVAAAFGVSLGDIGVHVKPKPSFRDSPQGKLPDPLGIR